MAVSPESPAKPPRGRRSDPAAQEELRQRIVSAASTLYEAGGLDAVTMRAVAAAVGMSAMGLYHYFPNKTGLVMALWDQILEQAAVHVGAAIEHADTPRARLEASIDAYFSYWEQHPSNFKLVFMLDQTISGEYIATLSRSPRYQAALNLTVQMLGRLADAVGGHRENVLLARDLRLTLMLGYLHSRLANKRFPWADMAALREESIKSIAHAVIECLRRPVKQ